MNNLWDYEIHDFLRLCMSKGVRLIMVGGGAVNFHGYQRHSAYVDFWIETSETNFKNLVQVFNELGYDLEDFPEAVKKQQQNISVNFSPDSLNLELITNFSVNKSFDEAYEDSIVATSENNFELNWRVLAYEDLITSKVKSGRPKDLLDIQELQRIKDKD
ncbi:DUF6036 family nucleotidyltransferase [Leeuwenhoekiella sp. H156]|uniref:DUF6036 family nucleotidyltransferase n=1 Tax=Leeuwenhoekiella sp. H156 TaxID=3450128 RepID=UPI003FA473DA